MSPLFGNSRRGGNGNGSGDRSAADRERDRIERERRRAEREGLVDPESSDGDEAPVAAQPPLDEEAAPSADSPSFEDPPAAEPQSYEEPAPAAESPRFEEPPAAESARFEEPPAAEPQSYEEPAPAAEGAAFAESPAPAEPHDFVGDDLEWDDPRLRTEDPPTEVRPPEEPVAVAGGSRNQEPPPEPPTGEPGFGDTGEHPLPLRRVGAPSVSDLPTVAGLPPRTPPSPPKRRRWGLRILLVALVAVVAVVAYAAVRIYEPFAGDPQGTVRVTIPEGASASDIGDLLEERGVVDSGFYFNIRSRLSGKRGDLKAGTFTLQRDMTYAAAIDALTTNPEAPPVVRVTLPEGPSIDEAASTVREAGIEGSYREATSRKPTTTKGLRTYDVPRDVDTLEGFLFPATYELPRGATAGQLVRKQVDAFHDAFDEVDMTRAKRRNLSAYDVVTIASMIEREAGVAKDRRLISAVIYNRLSEGMPLGIDATIRYREDNWTSPLKVSELERDGAYNTRLRTGLPPTPIGNPGLASLKAAANPANVDYLFYVVKPCGNGAHAFSSTDAGFQKDVAAYNKKREELGGKDPSRC